jgi:RNA polymerase sigma-70 factor, ECF subfamily
MTPESEQFLALYRANAADLLVYFERHVDDPELAIDLLSETFTRALETRPTPDDRPAHELSSWLWDLALQTLAEHQRKVAQGLTAFDWPDRRPLTEYEAQRVEEIAGRERLRRAARRSLARLPPDQREAVQLRIIEDLPYTQLAERLGVSVERSRTLVWRALRRLAVELQAEHGDGSP